MMRSREVSRKIEDSQPGPTKEGRKMNAGKERMCRGVGLRDLQPKESMRTDHHMLLTRKGQGREP